MGTSWLRRLGVGSGLRPTLACRSLLLVAPFVDWVHHDRNSAGLTIRVTPETGASVDGIQSGLTDAPDIARPISDITDSAF